MKIEMGESLAASWLKHCKGCTLVQTNWKPSPKWEEHNLTDIERLVQEGKQYFGELNVFKRNVDAAQILHQTECDAIGLRKGTSENEGCERWYIVESAFHENGVQYGDKHDTAAKIAGKMFRAAIGLYCYMAVRGGSIYFAAPKVTQSYEAEIRPAVDLVAQFFQQQGFDFDFHLLLNDEYGREMLNPVRNLVAEVSDTAELFLRALQLVLASDVPRSGENTVEERLNYNTDSSGCESVIKTGRLANTVMRAILEGLDNDSEIEDLLSAEHSREAFGLHFPLLVRVGDRYEQRRYYADPLNICGIPYRLCNDWYERNRAALEAWIAQHEQHHD